MARLGKRGGGVSRRLLMDGDHKVCRNSELEPAAGIA